MVLKRHVQEGQEDKERGVPLKQTCQGQWKGSFQGAFCLQAGQRSHQEIAWLCVRGNPVPSGQITPAPESLLTEEAAEHGEGAKMEERRTYKGSARPQAPGELDPQPQRSPAQEAKSEPLQRLARTAASLMFASLPTQDHPEIRTCPNPPLGGSASCDPAPAPNSSPTRARRSEARPCWAQVDLPHKQGGGPLAIASPAHVAAAAPSRRPCSSPHAVSLDPAPAQVWYPRAPCPLLLPGEDGGVGSGSGPFSGMELLVVHSLLGPGFGSWFPPVHLLGGLGHALPSPLALAWCWS